MDLDDPKMYEEYPPPPVGKLADIPSDWSLPWMKEDVVATENIPMHCMPCNFKFDKWLWPHAGGNACNNRACPFVHSVKSLKPPSTSWAPCQELPAGSPKNHCFVAVDWGSGHADNPVLHFKLSDTFPCKPARWLKSLSQQSEAARRRAVNEHAEGVWAKLCYPFTLFGKCRHWQNCNFLHVTPEARKREFMQHFCKCAKVGTQATKCKRPKCPYVHGLKDLSIPAAFLTPRFPNSSTLRTITWESRDPMTRATVLNSTSIELRHIAATSAQLNERQLCQDPYCNSENCMQGLHLLPSAWVTRCAAFSAGSGPQPPMPTSLAKHVHEANLQAARAVGPTRAPWYQARSGSTPGQGALDELCLNGPLKASENDDVDNRSTRDGSASATSLGDAVGTSSSSEDMMMTPLGDLSNKFSAADLGSEPQLPATSPSRTLESSDCDASDDSDAEMGAAIDDLNLGSIAALQVAFSMEQGKDNELALVASKQGLSERLDEDKDEHEDASTGPLPPLRALASNVSHGLLM